MTGLFEEPCFPIASDPSEAYLAIMKTSEYIQMDPAVMLGKPTLRGTRITVELVLRKMAEGASEEDVIRAYPQVSRQAVRAAMAYAAETIAHEEDIFVSA